MTTGLQCAFISFILSRFVIKYLNIPQNYGSKYDILKFLWLPTGIIGLIIDVIGLDLLADYGLILVFFAMMALFYDERSNKYVRNVLLLCLPYLFFSIVDIGSIYYNYYFNNKSTDNLDLSSFGTMWALAFGFYIYRQGRKQREEEEKLLKENQALESKNVNLESLVDARTKEITSKNDELEKKIQELKDTQDQLIHSEKMASLGELTAGIAHEIQNPLNFVNNFSEVTNELITELKQEIINEHIDKELVLEILGDMANNLEKIVHHGKRADGIVKGMLQHSRKGSGEKELTDINALADEYLRLSYHGLRAKDKAFNANMETNLSPDVDKIMAYPQEIGRVFLNIITNAFHATQEKKLLQASADVVYAPMVKVITKKVDAIIIIEIIDNATGIPEEKIDKIFQPFFTTKPTGQGTGLGLSIAYDIITKLHGGKIKIESKVGEGTKFIIELPIG
jgi:two-component system, NtrC family, sensor kinase